MGLTHDFQQTQAKLDELGRKVAKEFSDRALKAGGEIILDEQLKVVPRDSNDLAKSLIVGKISGTGAKRKILVGIDPKKADEVKYGFYQEHGTRVMLGKKWMRRSWNNGNKEAREEIAKSLAKDIMGE